MKRRISIVLLLTVLTTVGFSAKTTKFPPLPEFGKTASKPEKEEYNEKNEILNYIKKEGYNPKSEIRKTTDQTMEEDIKEIEAEKNRVTYTLFVRADEGKKTVEIVDTLIKEYYDILNEVKKSNPKIKNIDAATYAKGTDIMIYTKEFMTRDEFSVIARDLSNKVKKDNPLVENIHVLIYEPYSTEKPLYKENF